jgi:putative tryptophan/tyrosine transport system substrate-binding protein
VKRREFIAGLGSAAAWPLAARAQQGERVRRIGVLMLLDENDPPGKTFVAAFIQALAGFGWTNGRNVRMDLRWGGSDTNRIRALAQELVGLQPDIILAHGTPATVAVQRETRTIPIVFVSVADPVVNGIVARLDRPSGNITGFANLEASLGGKWLELLSEIAPGLKRAAIMFNPDTAPVSTFVPSFETAARSLKVVRSLRLFMATKRSRRPSSPWGASQEAALSSDRMRSRMCIARRSYRRRPETTYQRSTGHLSLSETAACFPTGSTG